MLYLITYNIQKEKDYLPFYNAIKNTGVWWHYIDSSWIIRTTDSAQTIYNKISPYIDQGKDYLLIIKINADVGNKQGLLPTKAWEWLNTNNN